MDFVFAALMVRFELPIFAIVYLRRAVYTLFSGWLVPLALMPWGLGRVFQWLPFGSMASAPLQIYVGAGNPAKLLAIQVAWCIVMWPLARLAWSANRQRLVSYGG